MEYSLTKQTIWAGLATLFIALSEFIFVPIFTKFFGSETYGIWAIYYTVIQLITPIVLLGLGSAFMRFTAGIKDKEKIRENFYSTFTVIFAFSLLVSLLFSLQSDCLPAEIKNLFKIGGFLVFPSSLVLFTLSYYRTFLRIRKYAVLITAQTSLEILSVLFLAFRGYSLIPIICTFIAIRAIIFVYCLIEIIKEIGIGFPHFEHLKSYLFYGLPLMVIPALAWIVKLSDRLIIKYFLDFSAVGIYSAAYNIACVITLYLSTVQCVLGPTVIALWNENKVEKAKEKLSLALKYFLLFAIPSSFGLLALSRGILEVFTKPEFVEKGYLIIPVVAFGITCYGIYMISTNVLGLVKKTYIITTVLGMGALINVILNFFLIPRMDILGAAVATFIAFAFMAWVMMYIAFKNIKFDLNPIFILKSILVSGIMAFIIHYFLITNLIMLLLVVILGAMIYMVILFMIRGITNNDFMVFKRSIFSKTES